MVSTSRSPSLPGSAPTQQNALLAHGRGRPLLHWSPLRPLLLQSGHETGFRNDPSVENGFAVHVRLLPSVDAGWGGEESAGAAEVLGQDVLLGREARARGGPASQGAAPPGPLRPPLPQPPGDLGPEPEVEARYHDPPPPHVLRHPPLPGPLPPFVHLPGFPLSSVCPPHTAPRILPRVLPSTPQDLSQFGSYFVPSRLCLWYAEPHECLLCFLGRDNYDILSISLHLSNERQST